MKRGLRFDRVARALVERVTSGVESAVADGVIVLFAVAAPIRMPAKTTVVLRDQIARLLRQARIKQREGDAFGNRFHIRIASAAKPGAPKVRGFVHSPEIDAAALFDEALKA